MGILDNKVAIVTGGARDIGRAVSIRLAAEGAKVCINYFNNKEQAQETLSMIEEAGGNAMLVQGDMTKAEDITTLISECNKSYGGQVDILVNVAGGLVGRKKINEIDLNFWNTVMTLNATTVMMVTQAVLPFLKKGGSIVNFASQAAKDGGGGGAIAYSASKGAVLTMSKGMAKELGPQGIRVNALCPGMIDTDFHNIFTADEIRVKVAAATPLGRQGHSAEVADLVLYLASDNSSFITGASIDINGGHFIA